MKIVASYITNTGKSREHQEDAVLFDGDIIQKCMKKPVTKALDRDTIFALSDGIAGLNYGEVASFKVLSFFSQIYSQQKDKSVAHTIRETQDRLSLYSLMHTKYYGMGATIAGVKLDKCSATIFNVGDSRVYLYRDGLLKRLSVDHSVARKMEQRGEIDSSEECANIYKMLDSAIVASSEADDFEICTDKLDTKEHDRFLICSDGLTDMVSEDDITSVFKKNKSVEDIVATLFENAMRNGGEDNISIVVIKTLDSNTRRKQWSMS